MLFVIPNKKITVLRYISPIDRRIHDESNLVPNRWLATKGLAIGNDLDKEKSTHHVGTWISKGSWPVYVITDKNQADYLMSKRDWLIPAGSVVYVANIDLDELEIGTNIAFCINGKESVQLHTVACKNGYWLCANEDINDACDELRMRFDQDRRLQSVETGDEFFIMNYKGFRQLKNEIIYRSNGENFIDVTSQVLKLRTKSNTA